MGAKETSCMFVIHPARVAICALLQYVCVWVFVIRHLIRKLAT